MCTTIIKIIYAKKRKKIHSGINIKNPKEEQETTVTLKNVAFSHNSKQAMMASRSSLKVRNALEEMRTSQSLV